MKQYIKAEFELFKKQFGCLIGGACLLVLFAILLLFSGIGGAFYCAAVTVVGCIGYLFFVVAIFMSPASHWENRRKILITAEQLVLTLGESKRTYFKIRLMACGVFYLGIVGIIAAMQIPAALIARDFYSLWGFCLEVIIFTAVVFLGFVVMFLLPSRAFAYSVMGWSGMVGGFVGGYFGVFSEGTKAEAVDRFFVKMLVCIAIGVLAVVCRGILILREERGGLFIKKQGSKAE